MKRETLVRTRRRARTTADTKTCIPGQYAASVTIKTHALTPHLANRDIADLVDRALHKTFPLLCVPVHAYCIMPDHLHLLVGGVSRVDLPRLIGNFISLTGSLARKRFDIQLWQWRYFATILDDPELVKGMARHILSNPERSARNDAALFRGSIDAEPLNAIRAGASA